MNLADCYRLLELKSGASIAEIKASYRRLAQQYHPDFNLHDQTAQAKFIALTEAYKLLLSSTPTTQENQSEPAKHQPFAIKITRQQPTAKSPPLSEKQQQLKQNSYQELQQLWKYHRYQRAIALLESLAQRLPQDLEVRQWQAIAYQRWGRQLIAFNQLDTARTYLKKALQLDPHNRSLWIEVERDFRRMEMIF